MKKVTDKYLLDQLNRTGQDEQEKYIPSKIENKPSMSAGGVFGQSAFRAAPEAIANLMLKLGLTHPETVEKALPRNEAYEQGRMAHPIADIAGGAAGFLPLGGITSAGIRAIPGVSGAMTRAAPSLIKRTGVHALEGGAIGSLYSPGGREGEGFGMGALIGGLLGGPGVALARNARNIKERGSNVANIEALKANRDRAQEGNLEQQSIIDALKRQNKTEAKGLQTPEDISRQINQRLLGIQELEPQANRPFEPTENLLTEPPISEQLPALEKEIETIKQEGAHYLRSPQPKGVEFAEKKYQAVTQAKQRIQKENYKPVEEFAKESQIKFPRSPDVKQIDEQIQKFLGDQNTVSEAEFDKYRQSMLKHHKTGHDLVNAYDFIEQWKSNKQAAAKAQRLGFKEGGENQAYWRNEALKLRELADKQLAILEQHLPKKYFDKLQEGDKLWKEHIVPFYGNKIYEQSRPLPNRGKIDVADIMHEIRGNEPGQAKVRELILAHPELTKLALGHKYAESPEALLNASPYEQQFINRLPALQGILERLKKAQFNKKVTEIHQHGQQRRFGELEEQNKQLRIQQKERLKAQAEAKKLEDEIAGLRQKRQVLSEELRKGKIKKDEFERLDKAYEEALKTKASMRNILKKTAIAAAGVYGVYGMSSAIKSLMK